MKDPTVCQFALFVLFATTALGVALVTEMCLTIGVTAPTTLVTISILVLNGLFYTVFLARLPRP